ncbi:MAG: beta-ketoacyl synthase N-terminal-like domain-containing protein, partial [Chloroflexota bacterium]
MSDKVEATEQLSPLKRALFALEKMQAKVDALEKARTEPIAIIGLGCRFPGGANDPDAFWAMLHNGVDAISEVPPERWDMDDYYDPKPATPGKIVTRLGGFVDQVDQFDAEFFGITPREAISLDPQQRLLLEVAWEALEDADVPVESLADSETGVFVGMMTHDYTKLHLKTGDLTGLDAYYATGTDASFASGRLSYVLGLHGPSMTLDTACSSSLVAVHLGVQSLRAGECQLALACGVDLVLSPEMHVSMSRFQALSPDGRCKTFDASADGFGRGEGCGVVVLKRLSDAQKDGDRILAVIRGSAVNHDGPSGGLTVPNGVVQQTLIRRALQNGGVKPAEVSYLEAHGTGTALGDPIEARAFTTVLGEGRTADQPLYVASLKTNIGHPGAVAGVAGLIKVVLSMQHEEIPPHLHLQQLSPHISWGNVPVVIPQEPTPWPAGGQRRVAGVSSFGLSGTNAHVVVEEYGKVASGQWPVASEASDLPPATCHLLPLSARSAEALRALAAAYAQLIRQETAGLADPHSYLMALCYTASVRRTHHKLHRAFVFQGVDDLLAQLDEFSQSPVEDDKVTRWQGDKATEAPRHPVTLSPRPPLAAGLVFVFSGQGSQ